jgi:hypothetical protein
VLADWRDALQPAPSAWWWSLDALAAPAASPHPLWPVLAGALITLAVSLATDVSLRFLSGRPDLLGLLGTFTQAMLALLAGSAFTRVGGEKVERLLDRLHIARSTHPAWKTMLAAALLLIVVTRGARCRRWRGVQRFRRSPAAARRSGTARNARPFGPTQPELRAGALQPRRGPRVLDHDLALTEYQLAIRLDERLSPPQQPRPAVSAAQGVAALALVERPGEEPGRAGRGTRC